MSAQPEQQQPAAVPGRPRLFQNSHRKFGLALDVARRLHEHGHSWTEIEDVAYLLVALSKMQRREPAEQGGGR